MVKYTSMNKTEFDKIINRIRSAFQSHKLNDEEVVKEYGKTLYKLDYKTINDYISSKITTDSTNAPTISELYGATKKERTEVMNREYCYYCNDTGNIFYERSIDKQSYKYVAACPRCAKGTANLYDGQNSKDHKTNYVIKSFLEYFPAEMLEDIKKGNMKKITPEEKERTKAAIKKLGYKMPDLKPCDMEVETCPF